MSAHWLLEQHVQLTKLFKTWWGESKKAVANGADISPPQYWTIDDGLLIYMPHAAIS